MGSRFVELAHVLSDGMRPYPGLPVPHFGAILDHESSRDHYDGRAEFYLGNASFPCNIGTYLDAPFHRFSDAPDLSEIDIGSLAGLAGIVVEPRLEGRRAIVECDPEVVRGRAVLIRTGWDERWGTDAYWEPGPFLAPQSLDLFIESRAALVGVDFWNVDDTEDPARPAHTRLLAEGIYIVEHMCNLAALPKDGFRLFAPALRVVEGASFPVRAFAEIED